MLPVTSHWCNVAPEQTNGSYAAWLYAPRGVPIGGTCAFIDPRHGEHFINGERSFELWVPTRWLPVQFSSVFPSLHRT